MILFLTPEKFIYKDGDDAVQVSSDVKPAHFASTAFIRPFFLSCTVSFFGHLSVHYVGSFCHRLCCTQSAPSLLIQSLSHACTHTHTIKARLCIFVSPIVTIFSLLLFPVKMLCHTAAHSVPHICFINFFRCICAALACNFFLFHCHYRTCLKFFGLLLPPLLFPF